MRRANCEVTLHLCNTTPSSTMRLFSLYSKLGTKGEGDIWLSVLGEVFDVTDGRSFYGEGSGYSFFAGKDASPCFATGKFNDEGLKDSLDDMKDSEIGGVVSWRDFYRDHEQYKFIGLLESEYFDKDGSSSEYKKRIDAR